MFTSFVPYLNGNAQTVSASTTPIDNSYFKIVQTDTHIKIYEKKERVVREGHFESVRTLVTKGHYITYPVLETYTKRTCTKVPLVGTVCVNTPAVRTVYKTKYIAPVYAYVPVWKPKVTETYNSYITSVHLYDSMPEKIVAVGAGAVIPPALVYLMDEDVSSILILIEAYKVVAGNISEIFSLILDFIPIVDTIKSSIQLVSGVDPVTGYKLAVWERILDGVTTTVDVVGAVAGAVTFGGGLVVGEAVDNSIGFAKFLLKKGDELGGFFKKTVDLAKNAFTKKLVDALCFKEGTLVETINGPKAIEDIEVGDLVLSKDEITGSISYKPVTNLLRNENDEFYKIYVNGEIVEATAEHPFYVLDKGWVIAEDLTHEDILIDSEGNGIEIDLIIVEKLDQTSSTYNFEVADFHTYFVGENKLLVHNTCALGRVLDDVTSISADTLSALKKVDGDIAKLPISQSDEIFKALIEKAAKNVDGADDIILHFDETSGLVTFTNKAGDLNIVTSSNDFFRVVDDVIPDKGFSSFSALKNYLGAPSDGCAWHHIVEQSQVGRRAGFTTEQVNNVNNIIEIPHGSGTVHSKISAHYSSIQEYTNGLTVRDWLSTKSFEEQFQYGLRQLEKYGELIPTESGWLFKIFD